jgi:hypothetical protein
MENSITEQLKEVEKQMEEVNHYGLIATIKEDGHDGHFFLMGNSHRLSQFLAALCKDYPDFKEILEDALEQAEE